MTGTSCALAIQLITTEQSPCKQEGLSSEAILNPKSAFELRAITMSDENTKVEDEYDIPEGEFCVYGTVNLSVFLSSS